MDNVAVSAPIVVEFYGKTLMVFAVAWGVSSFLGYLLGLVTRR